MQRFRYISIVAAISLLLTGCGAAKNSDAAKYAEEQDKIMDTMMDEMDKIAKSNDMDLVFLYGMIPHHESAVAMSNSYLKYANKNAHFRQLAENIIAAQNEEIKLMQEMITEYKGKSLMNEQKGAAYLREYEAMMDSHDDHNMDVDKENLDRAFAEGMIMHHQMAVDMAKSILIYTDDDKMIGFANSIIKMQEQEIAEMQAYMGNNAGTGGNANSVIIEWALMLRCGVRQRIYLFNGGAYLGTSIAAA